MYWYAAVAYCAELYLKRLVVGGFERVLKLIVIFVTKDCPCGIILVTMLEFYQAYADYQDLMNLTEELFRSLA